MSTANLISDDDREKLSVTNALQVLSGERNELRSEVLLFEDNIHKSFFAAFSSLSVVVVAIDKNFFSAKFDINLVIFFMAQTQVVLGLFILWLYSYLNLNRAYISEIESTINELCKSPLNIFESRIVPRYMFSWRGTFFWIIGLFSIGYGAMLVLFALQIYRKLAIFPYGAFLIAETLSLMTLFYFVFKEPQRVKKYIQSIRPKSVMPPPCTNDIEVPKPD
jgi:hypothetical protein